jgi:hypothetical protein
MKIYKLEEMVRYNVMSNRFTPYIHWSWLQDKIAKFIVWRTQSRHKRYLYSLERFRMVKELENKLK